MVNMSCDSYSPLCEKNVWELSTRKLYRFEVRVSDEFSCNAWDLPDLKFVDLCDHRFLFTQEKKILSAGFLIFSRKKNV